MIGVVAKSTSSDDVDFGKRILSTRTGTVQDALTIVLYGDGTGAGAAGVWRFGAARDGLGRSV